MSFSFLLRTFTCLAFLSLVLDLLLFVLFRSVSVSVAIDIQWIYPCLWHSLISKQNRHKHILVCEKKRRKKITFKLEMQTVCSFEHSPIISRISFFVVVNSLIFLVTINSHRLNRITTHQIEPRCQRRTIETKTQ